MGTMVHVDLLLGRKVLSKQGALVGRIEEFAAEPDGEELVVTALLLGPPALFDRLSLPSFGRWILRALGLLKQPPACRVDWDQIDLTDPNHPRLVCDEEDIRKAH
jgi:sporulation protein YlmC with PRC-barrel domain